MSNWNISEKRQRKYYVISEFGTVIFMQLKREWINLTMELDTLLKGDEEIELD